MNEKTKSDAYAAFVADDEKQGWCARSFFNAGWKAALAQQASELAKCVDDGGNCGAGGYCGKCEPAQVSQPVDQQLLDFYNVKTVNELIAIQEHHIKRLQEKLAALDDGNNVFRPTFPRG